LQLSPLRELSGEFPESCEELYTSRLPSGQLWNRCFRGPRGHFWIEFVGLALFSVSKDGLKIAGRALGTTSGHTLEHLHLNQVVPLAASLQSRIIFHGGAVEIDGAAVAFVGRSGLGKSTLTASFAKSGFNFLTDDTLELERRSSVYFVRAGHPSIRLWADSTLELIQDSGSRWPDIDYSDKGRFVSNAQLPHSNRVAPLTAIYLLALAVGSEIEIAPSPPSQAAVELIAQSFLLDIHSPTTLEKHLDYVSDLIRRKLVFVLSYPRSFARLEEVRAIVVSHSTQLMRISRRSVVAPE